jgi:hypothetical protein
MNKLFVITALLAIVFICVAQGYKPARGTSCRATCKSVVKAERSTCFKTCVTTKRRVKTAVEAQSDKKINVDDVFDWIGKAKKIHDTLRGQEEQEEESDSTDACDYCWKVGKKCYNDYATKSYSCR